MLFPLGPIEWVADRKGHDLCPHCGETRVTDCIHGHLTFLCGASGSGKVVNTKCEKDKYIPFVEART